MLQSATEMSVDWELYMRMALTEAEEAACVGDVPVGSVLVGPQGEIVTGRNLREQTGDPTAHAEIIALRKAATLLGHWRLIGWTCIVTLEPCCMCAGALINARVDRVVFGCRDPKAGAIVSLFSLVTDARLNHRLEVIEGLLSDSCVEQLQRFFKMCRLRNKLQNTQR